eukprot:GEMP01070758.1.p1 GENE.GEMP01070758.1~~GEMP01070758.1.p1  ORF type:complete len:163 (-),score=28.26 GEMP01070758.1:690-1178(-)
MSFSWLSFSCCKVGNIEKAEPVFGIQPSRISCTVAPPKFAATDAVTAPRSQYAKYKLRRTPHGFPRTSPQNGFGAVANSHRGGGFVLSPRKISEQQHKWRGTPCDRHLIHSPRGDDESTMDQSHEDENDNDLVRMYAALETRTSHLASSWTRDVRYSTLDFC